MSTDNAMKISADHLRRDAFLYVRQSSLRQVFENTESTKRQYALRDRAVALGWPIERVHVIDNDLGLSGAQSQDRDGFQRLVTEVAMGHAGIVLGLEVSRLARNNADWHRLLELAAMSRTLIMDEDGVYDAASFNDRMLLGLKGTMSEAELHILKSRLQGGILNKARRGELELPLPIGLVYTPDMRVVLDPDRQIQDTVRMLFDTFREVGSACAVVRRLRSEKILFPRRIRRGIGKGDVLWSEIDHSRVIQILHNPRYAGAFAYGRTRTIYNAKLKSVQQKMPRSDWQVLIPQAHEGYISWDEFERNLRPYYICNEAVVRRAGKACQWARGPAIDEAVSALLLEAMAPTAIEVALAVQEEISQRVEQAASLRDKQLQRARYEAELARRRYLKVDPDNRLVADALEADWNGKLRDLDTLQREHERQNETDQSLLDGAMQERIRALAADFPRIWNNERTSPAERKRMLGLLIEDVTLLVNEKINMYIRWRGGRTQSLAVARPRPMAVIRKTPEAVVALINELLETDNDQQIASRLNALGHRNWRGEAFTLKKVMLVRRAYGLKTRFERLRESGMLTGEEVARRFGVSATTVHQLGRDGVLKRHRYATNHRYLYEPPGNVRLAKGVGGRYGSRQPRLIDAQQIQQGAS
ncbi:recombinase family protein [Sinorhizobium medicae]